MSDLISRQAVDKIIDDMLENDNLQASPSVWHGLHMIKQLPSAQTVDAVPVIRCKDCIHWESMPSSTAAPDIHRCRYWRNGTVAYDYCGRAERKEE